MPITTGNIVLDTEEFVQNKYPELIKEAQVNIFSKGLIEFLEDRKWGASDIATCLAKALEVFATTQYGGASKVADKLEGGIENLFTYQKSLQKKDSLDSLVGEGIDDAEEEICTHGIPEGSAVFYNSFNDVFQCHKCGLIIHKETPQYFAVEKWLFR